MTPIPLFLQAAQQGYAISQRTIVEQIYPNLACCPATGAQIVGVLSGCWVDQYGQEFEARG